MAKQLNSNPVVRSIAGDDDTTDILDIMLYELEGVVLPLLLKGSAAEVVDAIQDHIDTHLLVELKFIKNGQNDGNCGSDLIKNLRRKFRALKAGQ